MVRTPASTVASSPATQPSAGAAASSDEDEQALRKSAARASATKEIGRLRDFLIFISDIFCLSLLQIERWT
jgi:hypothetical protein